MEIPRNFSIRKSEKTHSGQEDLSHLAKAIIANAGVGIYIVQYSKFVYVSQLYQQLTGYSDTELIDTYSLNYIYHNDRDMVRKEAINCLKGERFEPYEYRFVKKNNEIMWVLETITPIIYKEARATLGSFMDITERKRIEEALRQSEEKYRTILENIEEGYFEVDLAGNFTFFNDSVCRVLGYPREELMGMNNRHYTEKEEFKKIFQAYSKVYKTGETNKEFGQQIIRKDGTKRYIEGSISLLKDSADKPTGFRGILRDLTERKKAEEELKKSEQRYLELSIIDDLTQLYNSRHFYAQIEKEIERSNRYQQPLTLLMLDLDKFKDFNDTYGHVEGDNVLSRLSQVIKECLRETDSAYRYGGEEFTIMLPMTIIEEGFVTAKRIQTKLRKETFTPVPGKDIYMTVSIGLAQYKPKEEIKAFVNRADQLMYQAKKNGRDRICPES
jgi:diguanylate cyclase (GGDEF)-like protein/PAS domain S-box-containing protein